MRGNEMSHRSNGLKALGVCLLAVLGMMAFAAVSAQAENLVFNPKNGDKGEWLIEGKTLEERKITHEEVKGEQDPLKPTELLVPGLGLQISCELLEVIDGLIFPKGLSLAELLFSMCKVLGSPTCVINESKGTHITAKVNDMVVLHEGKTFDVFYPDPEGGNFTEIEITKCAAALPLEPVSGAVAVEVKPEAEVQLIEEYPNQALFSTGLLFGEEPSTLDGAANVFLSVPGPHEHQKWGAH
jgi:hypothetical protein